MTVMRLRAVLLATSLMASLLIPLAAASAGFSLLTPERLWDLARLESPRISPDGRSVVFTVSDWPRGADLPSVDLWLTDASGRGQPRQLTRNPGPDLEASWTADGSGLLYVSGRGATSVDLYLLTLRGGEPTRILDFPTDVRSPRPRGDTGQVVFAAETYADINADSEALSLRLASEERLGHKAVASESRVVRRGGRPVTIDRVMHLFELDPETGELRDLTRGFDRSVLLAPFDWDISPNGRLAAFTGLASDPPYPSRDRDIYLVDLDGGERINLTASRSGSAFRPQFTDQGLLLFGETPTADALAENTQLVRYDIDRESFKVITDSTRHSPEFWQLDPEGRQLYYQAEEQGLRKIFRTSISGSKARALFEESDSSELQIGPDGQLFFLASSIERPPALYRTDANGNHLRRLADPNRALLEDTRLGSAEEFEFIGHGGNRVHGFLARPPGFSEDRRWPLLILLHGGPHQAWLNRFHFYWNYLAFASPGYLVAAINPHGSTGYGQAFAQSVQGDPLEPAVADVLAALDHLQQLPYVDPDRAAVIGGSYGGYLANWLITRTNRFATAVVHAGIYNLMAQWGSDFPWGRERTYGDLPWLNPQRYFELSPSTHAARVKTPVLLLHGERDTRVPTVHSLLQHNLLTGQGIPSRLVLFPEEGHSIISRDAAERWWEEIMVWLERWLPPGPASSADGGVP